MNNQQLRFLKEKAEEDNIETIKKLEDLKSYIMFRAKKHLDSKNGMIEDEIVIGWAKHFYMESEETINKEMDKKETVKKVEPKKEVIQQENTDNDKQLTIFDV